MPRSSFDDTSALRVARGYHLVAGEIEHLHFSAIRVSRSAFWHRAINSGAPVKLIIPLWRLSAKLASWWDRHRPFRRIQPRAEVADPLEALIPTIGRTASVVVLEALAIELVLKVRLFRAGIAPPKIHDHDKLFDQLPAPEQQAAEQRYQAHRLPSPRATLREALAYSSKAFEQWRYLHEQSQVAASGMEMRFAFEALAEGL